MQSGLYITSETEISNSTLSLLKDFDSILVDKKTKLNPEDLEKYPYILVMGSIAWKAVPKETDLKFVSAKGLLIDGKYMVTLTDAEAQFKEKKAKTLEVHINAYRKLLEGDASETQLDFTLVDTEEKMQELIQAINNCDSVSIDTETNRLDPFLPDPKMVSIGFGFDGKEYTLPLDHSRTMWNDEENKAHMKLVEQALLKAQKHKAEIIGHNAKFDALWTKVCWGFWIPFTFDTMLAHYNLDENTSHGLKELSARYLGASIYEIATEEKNGKGDLSVHCKYLAFDVRYTYDLYTLFKERLNADRLTNQIFRWITMPAHHAYTRAQYLGTYINPKTLEESTKSFEKEKEEAKAKLDEFGEINWNSAKQVAEVLYDKLKLPILEKTGKGAPSCSESVLLRLASLSEVPNALLKYRSADKMLNTFLYPWADYMKQYGKPIIHPNFKIHGTVTGRPSCSEPNLQQVPRNVTVRHVIDAPEGYTLVEADLSQAELRIAGEVSGDPELKNCYLTGIDVHRRTVEHIFGLTNPSKEERKKGKAINFGFVYGMGWKKFGEYARDNYGVTFSNLESQKIRKAFFSLYHGLPDWHKRQKDFVRKHGYVRSLIGRKRRLPDALLDGNSEDDRKKIAQAERNAVNSPVQGLASDINLDAFSYLCELYTNNGEVWPCGTIHDASMFIVRNDVLEDFCHDLKHAMEHPRIFRRTQVHFSVPVISEVEVGPWGEGKVWEPQKEDKDGSL